MVLPLGRLLGSAHREFFVLLGDVGLNLLFLIFLEPLSLLLLLLLEQNVLLSRIINILEKVDLSLLLTLPLGLPHFELPFGLLLYILVDHLFVGGFIGLSSLVVALKLNHLFSALRFFSLFRLLHGFFSCECGIKEFLVSRSLYLVLSSSYALFSSVVLHEVHVPLSFSLESSLFSVFLVLKLLGPLGFQLFLLTKSGILLGFSLLLSSISLPRKDIECCLSLLLLFLLLSGFTSVFLLHVKHPKLGVDLLFQDLLL